MEETEKYKNQSDEQLVTAYQKHQSKNCIGELYARYNAMVYGVCLKYLKDKAAADDILMEIFESLFKKLATQKVERFYSWLYVVSKNACLMELRKKKPQENSFHEEAYRIKDFAAEQKQLKNEHEQLLSHLENNIHRLKEHQNQCVSLFYLKNKSYNEIETITGLTYKEIKSAIQNGKRNLRQLIKSA